MILNQTILLLVGRLSAGKRLYVVLPEEAKVVKGLNKKKNLVVHM